MITILFTHDYDHMNCI